MSGVDREWEMRSEVEKCGEDMDTRMTLNQS